MKSVIVLAILGLSMNVSAMTLVKAKRSLISPNNKPATILALDENGIVRSEKEVVAQLSKTALLGLEKNMSLLNPHVELVDQNAGLPMCMGGALVEISVTNPMLGEVVIERRAGCHIFLSKDPYARGIAALFEGLLSVSNQ